MNSGLLSEFFKELFPCAVLSFLSPGGHKIAFKIAAIHSERRLRGKEVVDKVNWP